MAKKDTQNPECKNQELEDLIQIISHDLKGPLRRIVAFINLIKQDGFGEKSQEYLRRIDHNAARMERLLNDLAHLPQVSVSEAPFSHVDLTETLNSVVDDFALEISELKAEVVVKDLPVVEGNPFLIRQLFQNLIGNALKYHQEGRAPCIEVGGCLIPERELWEIRVADNGMGFAPEFADRIFRPLERLHGNSQYEGSGMGLAICRKIVERHGGNICAQSQPGEGSVFLFTLSGVNG